MDAEAAALWQAIRAAPHDDAPRLIYADWLDEHGRPERAEFIRLQCQSAREDSGPARPREAELWAHHAAEWRAELPGWLRRHPFRRGFLYPERIFLDPPKFLHLPARSFGAAPLWDVVFRPVGPGELGRLVGSPRLRALDGLELLSPTPAGLASLLNGGPLDHLRSLKISGFPRGGEGLGDVGAGRLPYLRRFGLDGGDLGVAGAERLAGTGLLPRLRALDLAHTPLGTAALRALFGAADLGPLSELRVRECDLTADGVLSLVDLASLTRLIRLDLAWNPVGDDGAGVLALWPGLQSVRILDLRQTGIGPAGAAALIASPFLLNIRALALAGNPALGDPATLSRLKTRFGPRVQTAPGFILA